MWLFLLLLMDRRYIFHYFFKSVADDFKTIYFSVSEEFISNEFHKRCWQIPLKRFSSVFPHPSTKHLTKSHILQFLPTASGRHFLPLRKHVPFRYFFGGGGGVQDHASHINSSVKWRVFSEYIACAPGFCTISKVKVYRAETHTPTDPPFSLRTTESDTQSGVIES